jgi:hypothetical protein
MNNPKFLAKQDFTSKNQILSGVLTCRHHENGRFLVQFRYAGHINFQKYSRTIEGARKLWKLAAVEAKQSGWVKS